MSKYSIFQKAPVPFEPTHSSFQQNYALHRSHGDIPGCVPAVDVFAELDEQQVRDHIIASADHYANAVRHYIDGGFLGTGNARVLAMWEHAARFPKLTFIKNSAPKSGGNLYT